MTSELDEKSLLQAFQARPDIQGAIRSAAIAGPHYIELFNVISLHVCSLIPSSSEPATKKRRLDEDLPNRPASNGTNGHAIKTESADSIASSSEPVLLEIKDISLVVPQRKKYTLCFTADHLYARLPTSPEPVAGISYAWKDIEHIFCLPVPEKTQKQHNYILFPPNSSIAPSKPIPGSAPLPEPLVFTIPDTAPKSGSIGGLEASAAAAVSDDYKTLFDWAISSRLKAAGRSKLKIIKADPKLFASELRQAHRPGEKAVHVKAFRGSKDGYLFFLPNGILWGFKKPLLFLPHERIRGVSYTSVLQRTFNLAVEVDVSVPGEDKTEEFEFSMLDQEDFAGIGDYVNRHGLKDKSMAEQRKAKRLNVNVVKDEEGNVVGNAEAGELEKAAMEAEQEAVDEEDEDEEDYDPGSEGESEGSGTSSEEEDDDDEGGGGGAGGEENDEEDGEDKEL